MDDILNGMESQEVTALVALDLSAAFDTVDHDLLLVILKSHFGIDGIPLAWIRSYLDGRSFQVQVGSALSQPIDVPYAVPQGRLLGPVLFLRYIETLNDIIQGTSASMLVYADDHAVHKSFLPDWWIFCFGKFNWSDYKDRELDEAFILKDEWFKNRDSHYFILD